MSMYEDQRGITHTAASQDAVNRFDATMTEYVHFGTETGAKLKETLSADPEFPMAHLLPIRYSLPDIGGGHAQWDLFHQILIAAALLAA